jgi:hypothetical protein
MTNEMVDDNFSLATKRQVAQFTNQLFGSYRHPLQTKEESLVTGRSVVLECAALGCPVKYSLEVAPDWGGFFKLDEDGRPTPLR